MNDTVVSVQHYRACMGGWCAQRDHCGAYNAHARAYPAERLCERGKERPTPVHPVAIVRRVPVMAASQEIAA